MNELEKALCQLECTIASITAIAHGTEELYEMMQEEWRDDTRYYAFQAIACHLCRLTANTSNLIGIMSRILHEHREEMCAWYQTSADAEHTDATGTIAFDAAGTANVIG